MTTTVKDFLDAGKLGEAIQHLNQSLRARPTDTQLRVSLFELLCFAGDFARAGKMLDALDNAAGDAGTALALQVYRALLAAEQTRQQVFAGTALPKFLLPPPASIESYVLLLRRLAESPDAAAGYEAAEEAAPAVSGTIGDERFQHLRDADDRVAPVLEVFHGAEYLWLPFEQIRRIEITPPRRLRELMWVGATVEMHGHPPGEVFIPTLYVNSHAHADEQVRLGRLTEWESVADQIVIGRGQRVLLADDRDHALLDLRSIELDEQAQEAAGV